MKKVRAATVSIILFLAAASATGAVDSDEALLIDRAPLPGEAPDDSPVDAAPAGVRADTTWYGSYQVIEGQYYAVSGSSKPAVMWTFDRGNGPFDPPPPWIPNGEGWSFTDLTANVETYFRVIDGTLDLGEGVPPPIIQGERSLWVGVDKTQADSLCLCAGPGYGNHWCQRITSEPLEYDGSGDVTLSFLYWVFAEPCYDGVQIYLKRADGSELILNPYPPGACADNTAYQGGSFTDSIGHYTDPASYIRQITNQEIGGPQSIRIIFEFSSDGAWSDEDCQFETIWGPFGVDDLSIAGGGIDVACDFEDGLQGWEPGVCDGIGAFAGIADVGAYTILDPCACRLEGNILEMHDGLGDDGIHPDGQNEWVSSPICDLGGAVPKMIFMELDMYAELALENGVLFRPGWRYYPFECPGHPGPRWSDRVGQSAFIYTGDSPVCRTYRYGGTALGTNGVPVPPDAEKVMALIEIVADCDAFTIDPCAGPTNATPLFDNIAVGVTAPRLAPVLSIDGWSQFQDAGSYPSDRFDPRAAGQANGTMDRNLNMEGYRIYSGDSLVVSGPVPGSDPNTRWEARLWWRIARRAPLQSDYEDGIETRYKIWKDRVSDGRQIDRPDRPQFAFGLMDSAQTGYVPHRNKFLSDFREDDDDYAGEGNEENEMIWDDVLYPGSRIEYFITSNYMTTPDRLFYLPDTTGGHFYEFEILPGLRTAHVPGCGATGFDYCVYQPATLYIDAYNQGAQIFIENALRTILNGLDPCQGEDGCSIPQDRNWDRYDMEVGACCYNVPFARGEVPGSNNGMTCKQILGYRAILLNLGTSSYGPTHEEDFVLFDRWLTSPDCQANVNRQVLMINGDKAGEDLSYKNPSFLQYTLGATLVCDAFNGSTNDPGCGEENDSYCVRWLPVDGGAFPTEIDADAWGNECPNEYGFNVYAPTGGSVGNRIYSAEDGLKEMSFAQIVRENLGADANYRTILDGVSWHHLTARNPGGVDDGLCPRDLPSIVEGAAAEIGAGLKWGFGVADYGSVPKRTSAELLANCQDTWDLPGDLPDHPTIAVNRLYQNEPNPFSPATTIRFRLAQPGPVRIYLYDVHGRLVRTLVDDRMEAGLHSVVWDGTNDLGRRVGAGIYWSQMRAEAYQSNKKIVVVK